VHILARETGRRDILRRLRLSDGEEVWRYAYDAPGRIDHPGSRSTPATDGEMVYSVGAIGHLKAVRFSDGQVVWEKHLLSDWGGKLPSWAVSQSPLMLGDKVIVAPWGPRAAVVAYDKRTGEVLWTTPNPRGVDLDYQSVVPMMLDGRQTIVSSGRHGYTIGLDAATGQQLWEFAGYNCQWQVPSPTIIDGNRILLTGGYGAGSVMFQVVGAGGGYRTQVVWQNKNLGSHIGQALLYNGHIYANSQDTRGGLRCLSLDGRIVWDSAQSRRRFERGNLIIAGELVFIVDGSNGDLIVADTDPSGYKELATVKVLGGKEAWAPLAYSNGMLVLRDQQKLVCLSLTG
jgi:outer membrane protein assembly factor BamB